MFYAVSAIFQPHSSWMKTEYTGTCTYWQIETLISKFFFFSVESSRKPVSTGCSPFKLLIQFNTFITQNLLEFYASATQTRVHYNHSNMYCMLCKYMKQHSLLVNHISSYYPNSNGRWYSIQGNIHSNFNFAPWQDWTDFLFLWQTYLGEFKRGQTGGMCESAKITQGKNYPVF